MSKELLSKIEWTCKMKKVKPEIINGIKDFVWQTCREHNLNDRFRITPDKISIEAKGQYVFLRLKNELIPTHIFLPRMEFVCQCCNIY